MFGLWKTFFFGAPKILLLIGDSYFWGSILGSPKSVQIPGKVNHSLAPLMIEVIDLGRKRSFFGSPKSLSLSVIHIFEDDFGGKNPSPYRWFIFFGIPFWSLLSWPEWRFLGPSSNLHFIGYSYTPTPNKVENPWGWLLGLPRHMPL